MQRVESVLLRPAIRAWFGPLLRLVIIAAIIWIAAGHPPGPIEAAPAGQAQVTPTPTLPGYGAQTGALFATPYGTSSAPMGGAQGDAISGPQVVPTVTSQMVTPGPDTCHGDEQLTFSPERPRVGNELLIAVTSARPHPYGRLAGTERTTFIRERFGQLGLVWEWTVTPSYPGQHEYTFYTDSTIPCRKVALTVSKALATVTQTPTKTATPYGSNDNDDNGNGNGNENDNTDATATPTWTPSTGTSTVTVISTASSSTATVTVTSTAITGTATATPTSK